MNEQHKYSYQPLVRQIAENNQKDGKSMMQTILKKASLGTNKHMRKQTTKMFSKLHDIKYFHLESGFWNSGSVIHHSERTTQTSQPRWHKGCLTDNSIGPYRAYHVIDKRISPFDQGIASFGFLLRLSISQIGNIVLSAQVVKYIMNQEIECLNINEFTVKSIEKGSPQINN